MKFTCRRALCALSLITVGGAANAALLEQKDSEGNVFAIYDDVANLTWLADANYAKTSEYDSDGKMTWSAANAWADSLTIGGFSDWRLPDADPSCGFSYNCTDSEMGSLFYTALGGEAGKAIVQTHNDNFDLFSNVQSSIYWSATDAPVTNYAWGFNMDFGYQGDVNKTTSHYAWAVRSGDVGASSAVPEPTALSLIGIGTVGLFAARSRRARATHRTYG